MDDLKINKIAAGVLCGGLLVMGGIKGAEILLPHHDIESNAYPIEVPENPVTATAAAGVPAGPEPILALLAAADIAAGEKLSKKCTACHTFNEGGQNKVGPNLWGVVNAARGGNGDYAYSAALEGLGGVWDYTALNGFLHKPKGWLAGTKMNFVGLKKPQDRANIIAWMRTLSDAPAPLPSEAEIAAEATETAEVEGTAEAVEASEAPEATESTGN